MHSFTISCCILVSIFCIHSCSNQTAQPAEQVAHIDQLVGKITAVYASENYMLIQKFKSFDTDVDAVFYSRSVDGSVHSLKMTGQKLGQFYIADLGSGRYAKGDPIFMRDLRKKSRVDENKNATEALASPPES